MNADEDRLKVSEIREGGGVSTIVFGATLGGAWPAAAALDVPGIIAPGNGIDTLGLGTVT